MRVPPLLTALVALPAVAAAAAAQVPQQHAFRLADWYRVTTVGAPEVSPDGKRVAFTVTTVREAENRRRAEVWVASTAGGDPSRYTSPSTESSNPHWSPDGRYLYFSSSRPGVKTST